MEKFSKIQAKDLSALNVKKGVILDVRTQPEYDEQHLALNHVHVPLDQLIDAQGHAHKVLDRQAHFYILCRSGVRAVQAAEKLEAAGFKHLSIIEGGITACQSYGYPLHQSCSYEGRPGGQCWTALSLDRQVHIATGGLIVVGSFLTLWDSAFLLMPFVMGLGLVLSGVTGWCGLGLLLKRKPWNQKSMQGQGACCPMKPPVKKLEEEVKAPKKAPQPVKKKGPSKPKA